MQFPVRGAWARPGKGVDGAPVRAIVPLGIAETGNLTVNVIALSYAGTFTVTLSADPDQVPDLPVLAAALHAELDALTTDTRPPGS